MIKLISEGDDAHKPMAYTVIGQLGQRIPSLINKDLSLLHNLFDTLVSVSISSGEQNNNESYMWSLYVNFCLLILDGWRVTADGKGRVDLRNIRVCAEQGGREQRNSDERPIVGAHRITRVKCEACIEHG